MVDSSIPFHSDRWSFEVVGRAYGSCHRWVVAVALVEVLSATYAVVVVEDVESALQRTSSFVLALESLVEGLVGTVVEQERFEVRGVSRLGRVVLVGSSATGLERCWDCFE